MQTLAIALGALVGYVIAYHTYGRWLSRKIFQLDPAAAVPSVELNDDRDYVPTSKSVLFGHHFTSIAGTGPIVGPAIAVMWGWLPALLWVLFGSILIGAVHDLGSLVVSMRSRGQTVGDVAGRVLNKRVRLLFLLILFMALTIVLAIFGLVIASVFKQYPASIFPCVVQIPIAVAIGVWLHRKGVGLIVPSLIALVLMYVTVVFGDQNTPVAAMMPGVLAGPVEAVESSLHSFNASLAQWPVILWVLVLLVYSYVASVLPVWVLLQPRDYINSLQLISALGLVVIGLGVAAFFGGAPVDAGTARPPLEVVAPAVRANPPGAPVLIPFLFITIACGACSGFHCLVSSGTSSKQIKCETDAQFVGYGSMLTEGFLATLVILACVAGLGLGIAGVDGGVLTGSEAYMARYAQWNSALGPMVAAFVDGSANFLKAMGLPAGVSVALMGVLVASFAGTTLDTACRLQRYVIQELAGTFVRDLHAEDHAVTEPRLGLSLNPLVWLTNKHGATIFAVVLATVIAALPVPGTPVSFTEALTGNVPDEYVSATADLPGEATAGGLAAAGWWLTTFAGNGGLILWPLFGATNQLLAGLAFLVISFFLWRRNVPVWFIVLPMLFMLAMPAWAMWWQLGEWLDPAPLADGTASPKNWVVIIIGAATLALEAWMIVEAALLWPRVKGVIEERLPPLSAGAGVQRAASGGGPNC